MQAVMCLLFIAANPADPASKDEFRRLEGSWKVVAMEVRGKPVPAKDIPFQTVIFTGTQAAAKEKKGCAVFNYRLDAGKTPKAIEATEKPEAGKKMTVYGIYEVKGDTLRLCLTDEAKNRPTAFRTAPENHAIVLELKRVKR